MPAHWDLVQLGRIGRISKGTGGTKEDETPEGIPCIRYGDLYTSYKFHIMGSRTFVTEAKALEYTPIQYGDILFAGSGETIEEIGKSAVNLMESPACCGGDVILFRPDVKIDARFSGYAIDCPQSQYQKSCMGRGITIMHIYGDELKCLWLPLPLLPEQAAIVRFLDHADRRIQRYISAKQRLIKLLEEQKQAIINQAVTGQIDVRTGQPYPAYKPSGVEWLGDVPQHWEVRRLRYLIHGRLTYGANIAAEHDDPRWPRYLRITDFAENGRLRTDTFRSLPPEEASDYLVEPGDVLLARSGATVGKAFLVSNKVGTACHAGYLIRARLNRSLLHPSLFFAFTQSAAFVRWKDSTFIIATIQNIGADKYADLPVPVPPLAEQENLLRFTETLRATLDRAIHGTTAEIDLLSEYRTRLIADVVTGKLDVREAAAGLPDEVEELEPFDETSALIDGEEEPSDNLETVPKEAEV